MSASNAVPSPTLDPIEQTDCPFRKPFISYAHRDRKFAHRLAKDLRARGADPWVDEMGIRGGDDWEQKIEDALKGCAEVIVVVSSAAKRSRYVNKELSFARRLGRSITPVLHGWCLPWLKIEDLQHVDFRDWYDEGFAKLMQLKVPRRTIWRQILIFLNRLRIILPVIALLVGGGLYAHNTTPSQTSFRISGGTSSEIVVVARNDGGRASTIVGGSFRLDFGKLPIERQPLVMTQPDRIRVPGHSYDKAIIHLKMPRSYDTFRPKERAPSSFYDRKYIASKVSEATITLDVLVEESGNRLRKRQANGSNLINLFVVDNYPGSVPSIQYLPYLP